MDKFPPPNYIMVPSKLPGFEIYAPAEKKEKVQTITEFKCPNCGAVTAYSIKQSGLICEHCGYQEKVQATVVGKAAEENEFSMANLKRASHGWGRERKDLRCLSCGAEINIPPDSMAATCTFCGSNKVVQASANQNNLRPKYLVPFKVDQEKCHQIAREWVGKSWMVPKTMKNYNSFDPFIAIYLPYWTFDADTKASWRAEVGHTVNESYYDSSTKSMKTRTKIEWRWESGVAGVNVDDLLITGTERVSARHLGNVGSFNLSAMVNYQPDFLAGLQAKGYDRTLEQAWELAREVMRESTKKACMKQASTDMIRNFSMNMTSSNESWRYILLPVFLAAYRFNEKIYKAVVNGQTGTISGQRPVDWKKVWLVLGLIMIPGLISGFAGLAAIASSSGDNLLLGVVLFGIMIGCVIAVINILVNANKEGAE